MGADYTVIPYGHWVIYVAFLSFKVRTNQVTLAVGGARALSSLLPLYIDMAPAPWSLHLNFSYAQYIANLGLALLIWLCLQQVTDAVILTGNTDHSKALDFIIRSDKKCVFK